MILGPAEILTTLSPLEEAIRHPAIRRRPHSGTPAREPSPRLTPRLRLLLALLVAGIAAATFAVGVLLALRFRSADTALAGPTVAVVLALLVERVETRRSLVDQRRILNRLAGSAPAELAVSVPPLLPGVRFRGREGPSLATGG